MRKIEINYTNEYGEKFSIGKEVHEEDLTEVEFLHNAYKAFLNNFGYPVDCDERIEILGEDEFIDTYSYCDDSDYCDGDCESCDIDEDDDSVRIEVDENLSQTLKENADKIAEMVIEKLNKARTNTNYKPRFV